METNFATSRWKFVRITMTYTILSTPTCHHSIVRSRNSSEYDIDKGCWDKLLRLTKVFFLSSGCKKIKRRIHTIYEMGAPVSNYHLLAAIPFVMPKNVSIIRSFQEGMRWCINKIYITMIEKLLTIYLMRFYFTSFFALTFYSYKVLIVLCWV